MSQGRPACVRNAADVEPKPYERRGDVAGIARDIGAAVGTERIGVDVTEIPPGKSSSYLHHHKTKEEFFYVLSGRCRLRLGEHAHELGPGDAVSRPAGTGVPHRFENPYAEPCSVLMLGVMTGQGVADEVVWPELGRAAVIDADGKPHLRRL